MNEQGPGEGKDFFPKGALAFFALLAAFYASVWLTLYGTLLRQR